MKEITIKYIANNDMYSAHYYDENNEWLGWSDPHATLERLQSTVTAQLKVWMLS
jgi:hypothetical protein